MPVTGPKTDAAEDLWRIWRRAAGEPRTDAAIRALYRRLDAEVARRGPTCWASGKCCRFDEYGHRLFATGLEIAWVLRQAESRKSITKSREAASVDGDRALPLLVLKPGGGGLRPAVHGLCPFQINRLCSVRAFRPLGCRVFFCQKGTESWQQQLHECFLADLRAMHERVGLPYRYMEWQAGLTEAASILERENRTAASNNAQFSART